MKKIFKISAIALLLVTSFSCENDEQVTVQASTDPQLISPVDGSAYELNPANASNEATTLVWNHAKYSVQTEVNYEVQVALSGNDFASYEVGGTTTSRFVTWTVEALNGVMLNLGAVPFEATDIDVKIKASLGSNADLVSYSNVITLTVTPYTTETPKIWVPGSYQSDSGYGSNWTHSSAPKLAAVEYGDAHFEGYIYIANNVIADSDNGFKFSTQEDWNGTNYGDDGSFSGALSDNGSNIGANAGYYKVNVNLDTDTNPYTYTLTPTNWAITGSATPLSWPSGPDGTDGQDHDMTYNPTTKKWEITINLTGGNEIKFRANNAWSINYGDDDASDNLLNPGGGNIAIATSGTYFVELDFSNPRAYTYTLTLQ